MPGKRLKRLDLGGISDAEPAGALAVRRGRRNRGASVTKYGKTTAQLRALRAAAKRVFVMLRQVGSEQPLIPRSA